MLKWPKILPGLIPNFFDGKNPLGTIAKEVQEVGKNPEQLLIPGVLLLNSLNEIAQTIDIKLFNQDYSSIPPLEATTLICGNSLILLGSILLGGAYLRGKKRFEPTSLITTGYKALFNNLNARTLTWFSLASIIASFTNSANCEMIFETLNNTEFLTGLIPSTGFANSIIEIQYVISENSSNIPDLQALCLSGSKEIYHQNAVISYLVAIFIQMGILAEDSLIGKNARAFQDAAARENYYANDDNSLPQDSGDGNEQREY